MGKSVPKRSCEMGTSFVSAARDEGLAPFAISKYSFFISASTPLGARSASSGGNMSPIRRANTGIVPPECVKMKRTFGNRVNVPLMSKLVIARVVSKSYTIQEEGMPGRRLPQQLGVVG